MRVSANDIFSNPKGWMNEALTDKAAIIAALRPGKGVVVSFGAHGTQYAHFVGFGRNHRTPRVRIWRKAMGRWTKPRKLQIAEVIRLATDDDMNKFKPDFGIAWERD